MNYSIKCQFHYIPWLFFIYNVLDQQISYNIRKPTIHGATAQYSEHAAPGVLHIALGCSLTITHTLKKSIPGIAFRLCSKQNLQSEFMQLNNCHGVYWITGRMQTKTIYPTTRAEKESYVKKLVVVCDDLFSSTLK